ncbi:MULTISPECIES: exopolysaccharide production repressor protein [unclassified Mesorhizobium]|nr:MULTISPECIES: exopolysaccharide production repressor protein [unclassified Mesorhizobium]
MVYFALDSLRLAVVTTLACSLLLQACYFGSVLFFAESMICRTVHSLRRGPAKPLSS